MHKLNEYVKIAEAARVLGVSQNTLRAWADDGRVPAMINPANGYRLFRRDHLAAFLAQAATPVASERKRKKAKKKQRTEAERMDQSQHNWITEFIWGIADDVLRDLYVRSKYRDVVLPMTVLRRFDAVLEPTKQAVLDMKQTLDNQNFA